MTKSTKWFLGVLGILAAVAIGFTLLIFSLLSDGRNSTELVTTGSGDKIAVIELRGVITESEDIVRQFKERRENNSIKAIVFRVESPGGGVVASQEIYEEVKKTRESGKPVVVSMGSVAASGGYYVSCGASRIVANPGTLTGSIGVISEFLQLEDALSKLGVGIKTIKSGKLKDAGSMSRRMNEQDEKYFQDLMDNVHGQFIDVVSRERDLNKEETVALADGRVFTGVQAMDLHLVDTLGTYQDAITIAADLAGIAGDPSIVKERKRQSWFESMFGDVAASLTTIRQEVLNRPVLSFRFVSP